MNRDKKLKYWRMWSILGLLYIAVLFTVCLMPSSGKQATIPHLDKLFHFLGHFILTWWFSMIHKSKGLVFTLSLIVGCFIEYLQAFTGYRTAELNDVIANVIGASAGLAPFIPNVLEKIEKRFS